MAPYHPVEDWSYTENGKIVKVTIGKTDDDAYPSGWRCGSARRKPRALARE
jgi:hypothetical protein